MVNRKTVAAVVFATALSALFATCVFIDIDRVRVKLVQQPRSAGASPVRVDASRDDVDRLSPPIALIARIRNDSATPLRYSLSADGAEVCRGDIAAAGARRIDCAIRQPLRESGVHEISITADASLWSLEYLELATHHGHSSGLFEIFVLPREATGYQRPSLWMMGSVWLLLVGVFLLPASRTSSRIVRAVHWSAMAAAASVLCLALGAPYASPYRIVFAIETFGLLVFVLAAARIIPFVWSSAQWLTAGAGPAFKRVVHVLATRQRWIAAGLSLGVCAVAWAYGVRAVGAADEYGYASQADLWLEADLLIEQPLAREAPSLAVAAAFAPLGYRLHHEDPGSIVPTYAPGLPLLLAAAKLLGGDDAVYVVVPLSAGLLVLGTYAIGRRLGAESTGLIGAWLVATSPVVLYMMMLVMTDVPVATVWIWAFFLLLGTSRREAAGAGLLSGLAVLIRPNLAPLVGVFALRYVLRLRGGEARSRLGLLAAFGIATLPAAVAVAAVNAHLYGSPLTSGYGPLRELFAWERMPENLGLYLRWFAEAQTPLALAGFVAIFVPLRRWWPSVADRRLFVVIGLFVVGLWANYCAWLTFDAWWFTRFLIPSWPFILLGLGALAVALCRGRAATLCVIALIVVLGIVQVRYAARHTAFELAEGHRRFVGVAQLVRQMTDRRGVVVSLDHSGSIRYYGARTTVNFSMLDGSRLDELVDWLSQNGVRTYAALEYWELLEFEQRFAGTRSFAATKAPPLAVYETTAKMFLFDLTDPPLDARTVVVTRDPDLRWRAARAGPKPPQLTGPPQ